VPSFAFRFEPLYRALALPFGVTPGTTGVEVDDRRLRVRFGLWRVETDLTNVAGTERSGPYQVPKTIGPPHLSLKDRGMTCATNRRRGLCIRFHEPVSGIDPTGTLRHPGLTVTVADIDGLETALAR
jgi:hypothetical protein